MGEKTNPPGWKPFKADKTVADPKERRSLEAPDTVAPVPVRPGEATHQDQLRAPDTVRRPQQQQHIVEQGPDQTDDRQPEQTVEPVRRPVADTVAMPQNNPDTVQPIVPQGTDVMDVGLGGAPTTTRQLESATLQRHMRPAEKEALPRMHKVAYDYLSSIVDDPRLDREPYRSNHDFQEAVDTLRKIRDRMLFLPPKSAIAEHYADVIAAQERIMRAAGYEHDSVLPGFLYEGGLAIPAEGPERRVQSDMTYERQREMYDSLSDFFRRHRKWKSAGEDADTFQSEVVEPLIDRDIQTAPGRVFTIVKYIDQGGMGVVFEAVEKGTTEHVILKVSKPYNYYSMDSTDYPRTQIREAMALHTTTRANEIDKEYAMIHGGENPPLQTPRYIASKQIIDPGSVRDYEERTTPSDDNLKELRRQALKRDHARYGTRFAVLVMEKVEGKQLHKEIVDQRKDGGMQTATVENYAKQIIEATSWMHKHGVYHRDLKPGNFVLGEDGVLRAVDFGGAMLPEHVERQAIRIQASLLNPSSSNPARYAREPEAPIMTLQYTPDYELETDQFFHGEYARALAQMNPEDQMKTVQQHAARRDNYALGKMLYNMLDSVNGKTEKIDDPRLHRIQYVAAKLLTQNASGERIPEDAFFSLRQAMEIIDPTDDGEPIDVTVLEDFAAIVKEGERIHRNKQLVIKAMYDRHAAQDRERRGQQAAKNRAARNPAVANEPTAADPVPASNQSAEEDKQALEFSRTHVIVNKITKFTIFSCIFQQNAAKQRSSLQMYLLCQYLRKQKHSQVCSQCAISS